MKEQLYSQLPEEIRNNVKQLIANPSEKLDQVMERIQERNALVKSDFLKVIMIEKKITEELRAEILTRFLSDKEAGIREKAVLFLEAENIQESIGELQRLFQDPDQDVRSKALWVVAKFTRDKELTEKIQQELSQAPSDSARVMLAAALYLIDNTRNSPEMQFLKDYYLTHYYDLEKDQLKVDLTGEYEESTQIIGLILWKAGIELFALGSLEAYDLTWLIEKD
ncbi:MAG: hypothetical protein GF308_07395 [Candidatus Heimdallarchaeota archaeon]|nr:hypothetical protein [Candidatus Heimdallarchaeota archaeon]